ncbi:MAG: dicarboxylate/amino acid:cation symporter [Erysipelotrichales bacterium]
MILSITIAVLILISFYILIRTQRKNKISFPIFLLIALGLSLVTGLIVYGLAFFIKDADSTIFTWLPTTLEKNYIMDALSLVGSVFTSLMKMLIGPLIFSAIFRVTVSHFSSSKRVIGYGIIGYVFMVTISSLVTGVISMATKLGQGLNMASVSQTNTALMDRISEVQQQSDNYNFFELLNSFLPSNIINDLANNNMIPIIIFALIFGVSVNYLLKKDNTKVQIIIDFVDGIFDIFSVMIDFVLGILPYSIYALILSTMLAADFSSIPTILLYVVVVIASMVVVYILQLLSLLIAGHNVKDYVKNTFPALITAFSTASSNATLPVTIESLSNNNVSQKSSNVIATLGTTMGMAGCGAVYPTILTIMTYVSINGNLPILVLVQIVLVVLLASFGMQGVPGTAMYAATLALTTLNLPLTAIILVAPIDFFVDMFRTALNVNGSMVVATIVDKKIK